MALQIDSDDLFDLDARREKVEEHLFVLGPLGKRYLLCREPSIAQLNAMQLVSSGRNGDPAGGAADFLRATILTVEEIDKAVPVEPVDGEPDAVVEARRLLEADEDAFVDLEFLLAKMADPEAEFENQHLISISRTIMKRATAFPTKPSSDSSPGRGTTGSRSRGSGRRRASTPSS